MTNEVKKSPARKRRQEWMPRFLELFGATCNITLACKGAGVSRGTVYGYQRDNEEFAQQMADAKQQAIETLEAICWDRAKKKSDLLMMFLLKAHRPEMYRERQEIQHSGSVEYVVIAPPKAQGVEEWAQQSSDGK